MIGVVVAILFIYVFSSEGSQPPQVILPDGNLPWNSNHIEVLKTLDAIYEYEGKKVEWFMCDTGVEGLWQMCLKDKDAVGPFKFIFVNDKLVGYIAEFPLSEYDNLVYSGKHVYGNSHGVVKTVSREFRIYEMEIRRGWLELYMVLDRDLKQIRIQAKYKYLGEKTKTETDQPGLEDDKAWHMESNMVSDTSSLTSGKSSLACLSILTLKPLSSKSMKKAAAFQRPAKSLVLLGVLLLTNYEPLIMLN
jgi:hypothetical protein